MTLSAEQYAAVTRTGQDVCVVAGPGSGKTRVLVERFQWLVRQGIPPLRILAITFTEKAAHELKERLVRSFEDQPEYRREIERAYVSTLHAFCMRLLRENAIAAGLDPRFEILDERQAIAQQHMAATQALDELYERQPETLRGLLAAWETNDPAKDLLEVYEAIRVSGADVADLDRDLPPACEAVERLLQTVREMLAPSARPKPGSAGAAKFDAMLEWLSAASILRERPITAEHFRFLERLKCSKNAFKAGHPSRELVEEVRKRLLPEAFAALTGEFHKAHRKALADVLKRFDALYREHKRKLSVLDFSDLEERAILLLRSNPELRRKIQSNFDAVLMDELQDTNPLQWELMDLVRRPGRFFAVGDINQSIYGFRHAEPEVFQRYRERVEQDGGQIDRLGRNHRSRPEILAAVAQLTDNCDGIMPNPLEAGRRFFNKPEPSIEVIAAKNADPEEAALIEARWIARRIREIEGVLHVDERSSEGTRSRPARFSDIAVLVRNTRAVDCIEQAFREFSVPFLMNRGHSFFEEPEICDLTAWLRILINPRDEIALATVLRSPFFGISDETLLCLRQEGGSLIGAIRSGAARCGADAPRLQSFLALLDDLRQQRDDLSPDRLLARALDACGYEEGLSPRERANIDKFLAMLRDWFTRNPGPLIEWLPLLEELRAAETEPNAPANESADAVQVLTIHASKGLEFPIVFLAAMHLKTKPVSSIISYSPAQGLGAVWRVPTESGHCGDLAHIAWRERARQRETEEANRLLYVAMTRAEEHLIFSFVLKDRVTDWPKLVLERLGIEPEAVVREQSPDNPFPPVQAALLQEPLVLPRPDVTGQFDSTASVTAIAQYRHCPRQYYLQRYLGWRKGPRKFDPEETMPEDWQLGEWNAAELGTIVHRILAGETGSAPEEAMELAARFPASELGQRAARAARLERELEFVFFLEDIVLRGQIDLWFEEGGTSVLVDYKTDRFDESRVEGYSLQLRLYALALERMKGRLPDEAWLYFLRPDRAVRVSLDAEALNEACAAVREFREAQERLDFPLRVGKHCYQCEFYRGICPR